MEPKIKTRWLEKLRSGLYLQGLTGLKTIKKETKFCCLGVLGDCLVEDGKAMWNGETLEVKDHLGSGYLPDPALRIVKLTDAQQVELARMNDRGQPFDAIADWIEDKL